MEMARRRIVWAAGDETSGSSSVCKHTQSVASSYAAIVGKEKQIVSGFG